VGVKGRARRRKRVIARDREESCSREERVRMKERERGYLLCVRESDREGRERVKLNFLSGMIVGTKLKKGR